MPVFLAALIGGLVSAAGSIAGRVLLSLGFGFVAFTGIDVTITAIKNQIQSSGNALPANIVGMMGWMQIGTGINILLSAILVRFTLQGLTSGTLKKLVAK